MKSIAQLIQGAPATVQGAWGTSLLVAFLSLVMPYRVLLETLKLLLKMMVSDDLANEDAMPRARQSSVLPISLLPMSLLPVGGALSLLMVVILPALSYSCCAYFWTLWNAPADTRPGLSVLSQGFKKIVDATILWWLVVLLTTGGLLLLVVPGIIVLFGLRFSMYCMAADPSQSPVRALKKSWALVWGQSQWGRVALLSLAWFTIYLAAFFVMGLVLGLFGLFLVILFPFTKTVVGVVVLIAGHLLQTVLQCLTEASFVALFWDLRSLGVTETETDLTPTEDPEDAEPQGEPVHKRSAAQDEGECTPNPVLSEARASEAIALTAQDH